MKKFTCPCCGYQTLDSSHQWDICDICYWEDDPSQFQFPKDINGPNGGYSLHQAQQNFQAFGACDEEMLAQVRRPNAIDKKDPEWRPFV